MEGTGAAPQPNSYEARAALRTAHDAERAVRGVDVPWWFFGLEAALFAALVLAQLRDDHAATFMAVGVLILVVNLLAARAAGVEGSVSRNRGFVATMLLLGVVLLGSLVWYDATGETWTVLASAVAAAVLTLTGGWLYRRNPS